MPLREWFRIDDLLRPALLVTWAVPAARVEARLPQSLTLDTACGPDGKQYALLTAAAVLNVDAHPRLLPGLRTTCPQINFRTYVRAPGDGATTGVYFFGNYVGARSAWLVPWMFSPNIHYAPARMAGQVPAAADPAASWHVSLEARGLLGPVVFDASGPCVMPTDALFWEDAPTGHFFLTQRLLGFFADRWGGTGFVPVDHQEMTPWGGTLRRVTCAPWERWGLLTADEIARPLVVLVQPSVLFRAYFPGRLYRR
jgi:uncharacterized protein YqjF (DUF2071 family)